MNTMKRSFAIIAAACLLLAGTSLAMAGDQDQTQDRSKDKDQKQDGSCQQYTGNSELYQLLVKNGSDCDGEHDQDQDRDRDGTC